jgi:hypothetical protein
MSRRYDMRTSLVTRCVSRPDDDTCFTESGSPEKRDGSMDGDENSKQHASSATEPRDELVLHVRLSPIVDISFFFYYDLPTGVYQHHDKTWERKRKKWSFPGQLFFSPFPIPSTNDTYERDSYREKIVVEFLLFYDPCDFMIDRPSPWECTRATHSSPIFPPSRPADLTPAKYSD